MEESRINKILEALSNAISGNYTVEPVNVTKENGVLLNGFTLICNDKSPYGTKTCLTAYYNPEWDNEAIISHITEQFKKGLKSSPQFSLEYIKDKDKLLGNVYPVLLSISKNTEYLENFVWREFLDLAVMYRVDLGTSVVSVAITKDIIKLSNITEEELYNAAINNINSKLFADYLMDYALKLCDIDAPSPKEFKKDQPIIISNVTKYRGAAQILTPRVRELLGNLYTKGAIVVPSSIHEVIVFPAGELCVEDIRDMVKSVNSTVLDSSEYLSDSVYLYKCGAWEVI